MCCTCGLNLIRLFWLLLTHTARCMCRREEGRIDIKQINPNQNGSHLKCAWGVATLYFYKYSFLLHTYISSLVLQQIMLLAQEYQLYSHSFMTREFVFVQRKRAITESRSDKESETDVRTRTAEALQQWEDTRRLKDVTILHVASSKPLKKKRIIILNMKTLSPRLSFQHQ